MTFPSLLIVGADGHAKVVGELARALGWRIEAFVDVDAPDRDGEPFADSTIRGNLPSPGEDLRHAVVAVADCAGRLALADRLRADGWTLPTLVHPSAVVSPTASLGEGSFVMALAVLQADAVAGRAVIVNTGAIVEHDCSLGNGVHVAPGAVACGHVHIGDATLVGAGAVVRERAQVGSRVTIGAGAVVVSDVQDDECVVGVPARAR